MNKKIEWD